MYLVSICSIRVELNWTFQAWDKLLPGLDPIKGARSSKLPAADDIMIRFCVLIRNCLYHGLSNRKWLCSMFRFFQFIFFHCRNADLREKIGVVNLKCTSLPRVSKLIWLARIGRLLLKCSSHTEKKWIRMFLYKWIETSNHHHIFR